MAIALRHYLYMAKTETELTEISLRQRLKRETTVVHQHLEAQLGLLNPGLDVHRYLRVLEAFYGFYVPVEAAVRRRAAAELPLGFPLRARAGLLERVRALAPTGTFEFPYVTKVFTCRRR